MTRWGGVNVVNNIIAHNTIHPPILFMHDSMACIASIRSNSTSYGIGACDGGDKFYLYIMLILVYFSSSRLEQFIHLSILTIFSIHSCEFSALRPMPGIFASFVFLVVMGSVSLYLDSCDLCKLILGSIWMPHAKIHFYTYSESVKFTRAQQRKRNEQ